MAKYARSPVTQCVYMPDDLLPGHHETFDPVIVIPEADWKRMVELSIDSQVGHRPAIGAEIKAIIEKVKAANG